MGLTPYDLLDMPTPDGYCYIKTPEGARDAAREVKQKRGQTWDEFLRDAAVELKPDS